MIFSSFCLILFSSESDGFICYSYIKLQSVPYSILFRHFQLKSSCVTEIKLINFNNKFNLYAACFDNSSSLCQHKYFQHMHLYQCSVFVKYRCSYILNSCELFGGIFLNIVATSLCFGTGSASVSPATDLVERLRPFWNASTNTASLCSHSHCCTHSSSESLSSLPPAHHNTVNFKVQNFIHKTLS